MCVGVSGSSESNLRFFKVWKAGRGGILATKPRKYAAAQYTMLKGKLRKLLLIKSIPGC